MRMHQPLPSCCKTKKLKGFRFSKMINGSECLLSHMVYSLNVGDQVEIMSNGIFKRVLTNAEQEKNTLAIFIMPDVAVGIGPVEKLINEERPRAYKDIKNYVALFFQSYQQGKIPIEAAKISN
ncbi:jasmonate-induced oxygenase 4-like [Solanum lycopersicum]|uniref:jasmonate-induced oxygenase 4-like n=1 Tax=Solanum lycopersicum TaxID=4081 RepID=UPI00374874A2